ncbi:MAG TPA: phospho-N-acetylmuramoyl-pentapeptide-transferase, partial [Candidatus Limnocylindrales bacterium]|nr:phospho-N-acetylmuramoyl-pentapeptide-transferase [Candidatus Limnocylindrales bacterium]
LMTSFFVTVFACPFYIRKVRRLQYGQQIRDDGPAWHAYKAGTPTMGGVVFVLVALAVLLIIVRPTPLLFAVIFVTFGCSLLGFVDDYLKITRGQSLGLKARSKLAGMIIIAIVFLLLLYRFGLYTTYILLPYLDLVIDLGFMYPFFIVIVIIAASNSVNLTDGVDGLAAGTTVVALIAYTSIALQAGLGGEVSIYFATLTGSCLGFLVYNIHPARLFMGDTGSLALGGTLAAAAVVTKTELLLLIIGGVFVIEALSVIVQVASFQLTGRRILLMSPLHHHFELKGWSEWQVVTVFWGVALVFAVIGVIEFNRLV